MWALAWESVIQYDTVHAGMVCGNLNSLFQVYMALKELYGTRVRLRLLDEGGYEVPPLEGPPWWKG